MRLSPAVQMPPDQFQSLVSGTREKKGPQIEFAGEVGSVAIKSAISRTALLHVAPSKALES
jgi:hypothetical protein